MLQRIQQETDVNVNPSERIICLPCDELRAGGFTPELGAVVLCRGNFWSKKHMEHTLTHELVHMYDHCKFDVDWSNLRHHACSEVSFFCMSGLGVLRVCFTSALHCDVLLIVSRDMEVVRAARLTETDVQAAAAIITIHFAPQYSFSWRYQRVVPLAKHYILLAFVVPGRRAYLVDVH